MAGPLRPYTPPPLNGPAIKRRTFFSASLTKKLVFAIRGVIRVICIQGLFIRFAIYYFIRNANINNPCRNPVQLYTGFRLRIMKRPLPDSFLCGPEEFAAGPTSRVLTAARSNNSYNK